MSSNQSTSSQTMGISAALAATGAAAAAGILYIYRNLPNKPKEAPKRPQLVLDAMEKDEPIYYLGIGSNLSRKKLENRSISGQKINFMSMEPCVVHNYRLAFNMKAFPPLEPAMGSVEPLPSLFDKEDEDFSPADDNAAKRQSVVRRNSTPLQAYERQECHGALIKLSAHDYDLVYKSEGGGRGPLAGYEEIVVECEPYDSSHPPVKAVALRTREHVLWKQDPSPSKRYMTIIREGAAELGLKECYQKWLREHPVQEPSFLLKKIAVNSMIFTITLVMGLKFTLISDIQNIFLMKVYVLPTEPKWKQILGEVAAGAILLPTACIGLPFRSVLQLFGKFPKQLAQWVKSLES